MVEQTRQLETEHLDGGDQPTEDVNFGRHITIAVAIIVLAGILTLVMEAT